MKETMERIQKILCNSGFCSRRQAEELIIDRRVKVNGKTAQIGDNADENDDILVDNKPIKKERKTYILFNKPKGCVTALRDPKYKTVMNYIKTKERIFPIGRLDFNTTGILLLTNDGDFANKIMHPSNKINKTYLVETRKPILRKDIKLLQKGIKLDDGMTSPARVYMQSRNLVELTIHEGRNRIVRRMFDYLGYQIRYLERVRIGRLTLGNIKPGRYRTLNLKDKKLIFS